MMEALLLGYSVAKQWDILCQAKSIVKNRDERTGYLLQLLKLVEDDEVLANYECQLRVAQN